ncbi:MAG TPA: protein translocase subunit SecD, partial [Gemmataceae bacterium]|nr:protein translocase subunit SecD [Gemmataceae bacterium]
VDRDKFPDTVDKDQDGLPKDFNIADLAASLKRRIDPADLYNVTIRPVGRTRVEIILPTGGHNQTRKEEDLWDRLLTEISSKWPPKEYKVGVGNRIELVARINEQYPSEEVASIQKFIDINYDSKIAGADAAKTEAAWKGLLAAAAEQWKPRKYEAGRGRVQILLNRVREQYPDAAPKEISDFINENFVGGKEHRALTTEEVERIKELIAQVGSLEFRILANTRDDKDAIEAAEKFFVDAQKEPKVKADLEALALAGKPPPPPMAGPNDPFFDTASNIGKYSYSWVELGKAERRAFGLDNAAAEDPQRRAFWDRADEARKKGEAYRGQDGQILLYSRPVINPRLPEKDANKKYEYFVLTRDPEKGKEVTGLYLARAFPETGSNLQLEVGFQFNSEGGRRFHDLTSLNAPEGKSEGSFKRRLAVILDGVIESAPNLNAIISESGVIQGSFTKPEVDRLVAILKAGALPASLKRAPVSETTMGPTLGEDTIRSGTISVAVAFIAILLFMIGYYWFAGIVACVALLANLLLTVAFMVLVNATFTLPGLAGLVLTLGMAVDANVLIYERLREERERGASLPQALRNGYDKAFPTIIDTHLSSIFTAIVLYTVGNDQLKGFGISLTVGLVISLFTSLFMTRLLFDIWQYKGWLKKLTMMKLFSKPSIDFMAIRYYWFTATIILTIVGASLFFYHLDKGGLNIDFTKGTAYSGQLSEPVSMVELRSLLGKSDLPDLSIEQTFVNSPEFTSGERSKLFTVRTSEQDRNKVIQSINKLLGSKLHKTELQSFEVDKSGKDATLAFVEPGTKKPAFASLAQVSMLLTNELNSAGLGLAAQQFTLDGLGKEQEGRFQWMHLQLMQPVEPAKLQTVLDATKAAFAATPQPERLENFDSQLASETQKRALYAILASWAAILLYLWFRFGSWTFGLAAVVCLIHDLFFTLGWIALCHYIHESMPGVANALLIQDFKIDLPTVAALLTLVGYSVSDTIVVFDRIREVRGKSPELTSQMINESVNQTLSRTLLTAFSVWLVVLVLYIWGGEGVHLFAFVMVVGVIVGTYSSIYIASPLLLIFREGAPVKSRVPAPSGQAAKALT